MQKILYEKVKKYPEKNSTCKDKLIQLAYDKIKLTQKFHEHNNQ